MMFVIVGVWSLTIIATIGVLLIIGALMEVARAIRTVNSTLNKVSDSADREARETHAKLKAAIRSITQVH